MNPAAARAAILVVELLTFLLGTALLAYFISFASALEPAPTEPPPPHFPVLVYEGDRERPVAAGYRVVPWSEWERIAAGNPGASLVPPQRAAEIAPKDGQSVSFTSEPQGDAARVELRWRAGQGEQLARYVARPRSIEPSYLRILTGDTLLTSAIASFILSFFVGRALRRRWLSRPYFSPTALR